MEDIARACFVIDGNYTRKGFSHLTQDGIDGNYYSINFAALTEYTASLIEAETGTRCVFSDKKVFMGTNAEFDRENQKFYRALDEAGFQRNTFNLRSQESSNGRLPTLKEDAVDTTIVFNTAKEFYTKSRDERFDTLVLYAGDGDLSVLVSGLKAEGVRVFVIYYDFKTPVSITRASQNLLETADKAISISSLLDERVSQQIKSIFTKIDAPEQTFQVHYKPGARSAFETATQPFVLSEKLIIEGISNCRKDDDGWALVAQLGKSIEYKMGAKLPFGTKLRAELARYPKTFETKEVPAFSVRIKPAALQHKN